MVFDPFDDESEDWDPDPEAKFEDPDDDSLTIPRVETEDLEAGSDVEPYTDSISIPAVTTDETDAPTDLLETFWAVVVLLNGALFTLALGAFFVLFNGNVSTGGWLLLIGLILSGFAARRYSQYHWTASERATTDEDEADGTTELEETTETDERAETLNTDATDASHTRPIDDSDTS
ncbi:hypothetical protein [Natrinema sp. 74]|uniref:DUF7322 domain-containing protein n=1 Tax=Natrinema sp. 74 TaxID=3384159 RepID=UPI0038D47E89